MTISVPGVDNGLTFASEARCPTFAWAARDQQSEAGRVAITIHNQSARFPERLIERLLLLYDGFGLAIGGAINETGSPVVRRVRLYRRSDGQFVGETLSNADGDYRIGNMPAAVLHYAIALDDLETDPNFNALINDQLVGGEVPALPAPQSIGLYYPAIPLEWSGAPGHRFWRFTNFVHSGSSAGVQFAEIEPYDESGSILADATVTGTDPTATTPGGGPASYAADGDLDTEIWWNQTKVDDGAYLQFEFATARNFVEARMGAHTNVPTYWVSQMTLQYSDDGSAWITRGTVSPPSFPGIDSYTAAFALP